MYLLVLLFMLLNLVQRMHFYAIREVCTPDQCQWKDVCELRSFQRIQKLFFLRRLLAVTAFCWNFLPFFDTRLAVDRTLAKVAINWGHFRGHNDLLTDDTEGVGKHIKLVQFFPVLDAIFSHLILWPARVGSGFSKRWQADSAANFVFKWRQTGSSQ